MPTTIGPITNVPMPGDPVDNDWAVDLTTFAVNNVSIGAVAPTDPNAELWYDTADAGVSFPNMPRGLVAPYGQLAAAQNGIGAAAVDLAGMTTSFQATSGRNYKLCVTLAITKVAANSEIFLELTNAANGQYHSQTFSRTTTSPYDVLQYVFLTKTFSGAVTVKARLSCNAGTVDARFGFLWVEDMGGI